MGISCKDVFPRITHLLLLKNKSEFLRKRTTKAWISSVFFFLSKVFTLHTQTPHIHSESIAFTNLVIQHAARHASCVMLKNVVRCLSMLYPTSTSVPLVSSLHDTHSKLGDQEFSSSLN